jgi:cyclopropane-fatty-acyl-phospholipid synthase
VTLSTEQYAYAQHRANETGMGDRVRFLLRDHRREEGRYDCIVSGGMFEHVGVGLLRFTLNQTEKGEPPIGHA